MPKIKTHRGAAKRFRKTGTGKLTGFSAFTSHILTSKTTKRKRNLRKRRLLSPGDAKRIKVIMPG